MIKRPLSLFLASRNVMSKRDNRFISFVAFVSTLGLVLGVATLIVVLSVMNGFKEEMQTKLLGVIPHIQTYAPSLMTEWHTTAAALQKSDANIQRVSPTLNAQAMLVSSGAQTDHQPHVLLLSGVIPEYEKQLSFLGQEPQYGQGMIQGDLETLSYGNNIILGKALADEFNIAVGDTVYMILPKSSGTADIINPVAQSFTVSGIFKLSRQSEQRLAFTHLSSVAHALGVTVGAQGFRLQLKDVFLAKQTAKNLATAYPDFIIQPWTQTHGSVYRVLQLNRNMSGLLLFLIIVVAGFNLISSLVMVVTDKKAEIAILKTMGATPATIRATFLWQGLIITLIGTTLGAVVGVVLAYYISGFSNWLNTTFNLGMFDDYFVTQLPSVIVPLHVIAVMGLSVLVGLIATVYPATRAAQVEPARALRYE